MEVTGQREGGRVQTRALEGSHRDWSRMREQPDKAREKKCWSSAFSTALVCVFYLVSDQYLLFLLYPISEEHLETCSWWQSLEALFQTDWCATEDIWDSCSSRRSWHGPGLFPVRRAGLRVSIWAKNLSHCWATGGQTPWHCEWRQRAAVPGTKWLCPDWRKQNPALLFLGACFSCLGHSSWSLPG